MQPDIEKLIHYHARLSEYSTFQLGGPCKGVLSCPAISLLEDAVRYFNDKKEMFIVIGQGSNLLFSDKGIEAYVLRFFSAEPVVQHFGHEIKVSASTVLDDLVKFSVEKNLSGLSVLSGIPGTVGGAVVGNAGAFGRQISDCIDSVEVITSEGIKKNFSKNQMHFSYRHSSFKEGTDIITNVTFVLDSGDGNAMKKEREEILALRKEKHPDYHETPCAGSFFRNIELREGQGKREAAGKLLEQIGAKSLNVGGASVFPKHANIIIKSLSGTAQDVYELSRLMTLRVKEKFQIDLIREVRFVGDFDAPDSPSCPPSLFW